MVSIVFMNEALHYFGDALHEIQAERGCAVLFVSSKGKLFKKELLNVFEQSQAAFEEIRQQLKAWRDDSSFDDELLHKIKNILENSLVVKSRQSQILNLEFNATEIIGGYSHDIISPLMEIMVLVALLNKNNDPAKVSAYSFFLQLKEKFGRERALGARGLMTQSFDNREFLDRFRFLLAEQDSFKRSFFSMADDKQKKIYDSIMHGNSIRALDNLQDRLKSGHHLDIKGLTPQEWFRLTSDKINLMKKVGRELTNSLQMSEIPTDEISQASHIQITRPVEGITAEQRKFIEALPFFINLPENITSGLLQHGQVRDYKKGKLLFLAGEVSSRLHIILSGWVKSFKGRSDGEETVLQMLTSGDMIAESSVFLNATYAVSAQVVKDAVILTLPAPIIREKIKLHNELALRLLNGMSKNSHILIQEFENIRLKPATERVGWFLLKILVENGQVPDLIELPYDKSLIASYLDMKPETFSRTLKRFKDNGFKINRNSVILPNVNALCGFCDHDLAAACDRHGTPECAKPDCSGDNITDF